MSNNKLQHEEKLVLLHKGTEPPYSGDHTDTEVSGTYSCKQCNTPLFLSTSKFHSGCGWPSFDDAIPGAVKEVPDADGMRTEIICNHCGGHLGHVFRGEGFTDKNTRHCVNSLSIDLIPDSPVKKAWFGGGCFWGVEHLLQELPGVITVVSGYMGGSIEEPTYDQVCTGTSGHVEVVEVLYDPSLISYRELAKQFFEIHDPTQLDRQGPDRGSQYRSAIFVENDEERQTIQELIQELKDKGFDVVTEVNEAVPFYRAESYHQNYYKRKGSEPYCHFHVKRF